MISRVYIDMDQVVADFNLGIARHVLSDDEAIDAAPRLDAGESWEEVLGKSNNEVWRSIDLNPRPWWDDLYEIADRFPDAPLTLRLYDALCTIATRVTFLTAIPSITTEDSAAGKIGWLRKRLGRNFKDIHLCAKVDKADLAAPGRVLIDDNMENCTAFVEAGGGAVRYWPATSSLNRVVKLVARAATRNCLVDMHPGN